MSATIWLFVARAAALLVELVGPRRLDLRDELVLRVHQRRRDQLTLGRVAVARDAGESGHATAPAAEPRAATEVCHLGRALRDADLFAALRVA